ncbi:putative indole-3-acetic acid-amido synthetase GH3.1-like [Capsicum annuum]|nr:putative indole-3-acetic acid-amido synthetase GH3.1-like [Capsicum annuum]
MASPSSTRADIKYQRGKQKGNRHTSDSGLSEKLKVGGMSTSKSHSNGKRKAYREVNTKILYKSFKENNYPDCDAKKKLVKELGITAYQKVFKESPSSSKMIGESLGTESKRNMNDASCNGVEKLELPKRCSNGEKWHEVDMSEGDVLIQNTSRKESGKPAAEVDMKNQGSDVTPCNRTSKKQKAKVIGSANSQNDNMTDQGSMMLPKRRHLRSRKLLHNLLQRLNS